MPLFTLNSPTCPTYDVDNQAILHAFVIELISKTLDILFCKIPIVSLLENYCIILINRATFSQWAYPSPFLFEQARFSPEVSHLLQLIGLIPR